MEWCAKSIRQSPHEIVPPARPALSMTSPMGPSPHRFRFARLPRLSVRVSISEDDSRKSHQRTSPRLRASRLRHHLPERNELWTSEMLASDIENVVGIRARRKLVVTVMENVILRTKDWCVSLCLLITPGCIPLSL